MIWQKEDNFFWVYLVPLFWWFDKKGERNLEIYRCIFSLCMFTFVYFYNWYKSNWYQGMFISFPVICMFICSFDVRAYVFCLWKKGEVFIFVVYKKGKKYLVLFDLFMHICLCLKFYWISLYVYVYLWIKGELLESSSLIHAYITPWVLSSSKRGRLLA